MDAHLVNLHEKMGHVDAGLVNHKKAFDGLHSTLGTRSFNSEQERKIFELESNIENLTEEIHRLRQQSSVMQNDLRSGSMYTPDHLQTLVRTYEHAK